MRSRRRWRPEHLKRLREVTTVGPNTGKNIDTTFGTTIGRNKTRESTMTDLTASTSATTPATESGSKPPLPDRLSVDPTSKHYAAAVLEHDIVIRFNGKDRHDVEEYCISEGWIRVPAGKTLDRRGRPLLITLKGTVEALYR
jgi:hypothetical protein